MFQSLFVYGFSTFFMFLLGIIAWKRKVTNHNQNFTFFRYEIVFLMLIFTAIAGARYDVGVDYLSYLSAYEGLLYSGHFRDEHLEIGFQIILQLFAFFDLHFFWLFGFLALLQIFFIFYSFNFERYLFPFLIFIIMTGGIFFTLMNEIRQGIVICMFIYAVKYIHERKLIPYLTLCFVGFLIHKSALIFIPIYFILKNDKDFFKSILFQIILLFSAVFLSNSQIWNYWISYIEYIINFVGYGDSYGGIKDSMSIWEREFSKGIRYYAPLIINLIVVLYSKRLKSFFTSTKIIKYYNLYFIGALSSLIFYNNVLMQRPARFFIIFQIVIYSYLLYYLWVNKKKNRYNLLIFVSVIILHIGILYAYIASDHHTMYQFFWERNY